MSVWVISMILASSVVNALLVLILRNLRTSPVRALQVLKPADARRSTPLMAIVLNQNFNNADAGFRACPTGLTGKPSLGVRTYYNVQTLLQSSSLIVNFPVSQSAVGTYS